MLPYPCCDEGIWEIGAFPQDAAEDVSTCGSVEFILIQKIAISILLRRRCVGMFVSWKCEIPRGVPIDRGWSP